MFHQLRNGKVGKYILKFLILVFLNLSIDAPDILSKTVAYNEQETLIELIIEKALGFEDAILEQEHDNELPEKSSAKKLVLQFQALDQHSEVFNVNLNERFLSSSYIDAIYYFTYFKLISPPPEFTV